MYVITFCFVVVVLVRVTISWYDPPTAGSSTKALLHDLDLIILSPDNNQFYGNGNIGSPDRLNNNEKVFIDFPIVGIWKVKRIFCNLYS